MRQHAIFNYFTYKGMKNLSNFQHFIGCDVSKDTLDFAFHARGTDYRQFEHLRVDNSESGFKKFCKWLGSNKIKLSECVVGMEHTGIYSEGLSQWCHAKKIAFVMLHPLEVKNASCRGRNKTDKVDAQFIAQHVYTYREELTESDVEPKVINTLRQLYNERRLAVRTRTAYSNQAKTVSDARVALRIAKTIERLTQDIKEIDAAIREEVNADEAIRENYGLLTSIKGIGLVNAVLTIIATGNFTRFQNARQYAKFVCVSPMSRESGSSVRGGCHVSHAGHSEIKSILTEAARVAIASDPDMKAYFTRKREQGKSYGCVMNAVKFKLISRMFAVVKRKKPYVDVNAYLSQNTTPAASA